MTTTGEQQTSTGGAEDELLVDAAQRGTRARHVFVLRRRPLATEIEPRPRLVPSCKPPIRIFHAEAISIRLTATFELPGGEGVP